MERWKNHELNLIVPVKHFPAFVLNKYVLSGLGGIIREEAFERMLASWYESKRKFFERREITIKEAERLGYMPFSPWEDEELEAYKEERLEKQDLNHKSFDLNLVLSGIPAYLFEKVPSSGLVDLVDSKEGLARRIIFDWHVREKRLLERLGITREEADKEGYLPKRRK